MSNEKILKKLELSHVVSEFRHYLNNPMMVAFGYFEMLQDYFESFKNNPNQNVDLKQVDESMLLVRIALEGLKNKISDFEDQFQNNHIEEGRRRSLEEYNSVLIKKKLGTEIQSVAQIGGWSWNIKTGQMYWTNETYKIHEVEKDFQLTKEAQFAFYTPESEGLLKKCFQEAIELGRSWDLELELKPNRDNKKWVRSIGRIELVNGVITSVYGTTQDITSQKNINQQILEKQKLEMQIEFERSKSIQTAKLAVVGEMASGIVHEINNPLAIIKGSMELLSQDSTHNTQTQKRIRSANSAVDRISKTVSSLKKFARNSSAKNGKCMQSISLKNITEEVFQLIDFRVSKAGVQVIQENLESINIYCDEIEMQQVLVNLINNSLDAIQEQKNKWIKISGHVEKDQAIIQVIDSGPGLSDPIKEKLFQPYFSNKKSGYATGLGLSVTKGIISAHGGRIRLIENIPNTGFEILVPTKPSTRMSRSA